MTCKDDFGEFKLPQPKAECWIREFREIQKKLHTVQSTQRKRYSNSSPKKCHLDYCTSQDNLVVTSIRFYNSK